MVRIKHRYLLVNILYPEDEAAYATTHLPPSANDLPYVVQFRRPSPNAMNGGILMRLIRDGVAHLFGDYGSGMIAGSLQVKYFSPATSTAIIRVAREHYRLVWAALTFTTRLPHPVNRSCVMQVVRVSGTIKKAEEEAIRRAKSTIKRARASAVNSGSVLADVSSTTLTPASGDLNDGLDDLDDVEAMDEDDFNEDDGD